MLSVLLASVVLGDGKRPEGYCIFLASASFRV